MFFKDLLNEIHFNHRILPIRPFQQFFVLLKSLLLNLSLEITPSGNETLGLIFVVIYLLVMTTSFDFLCFSDLCQLPLINEGHHELIGYFVELKRPTVKDVQVVVDLMVMLTMVLHAGCVSLHPSREQKVILDGCGNQPSSLDPLILVGGLEIIVTTIFAIILNDLHLN